MELVLAAVVAIVVEVVVVVRTISVVVEVLVVVVVADKAVLTDEELVVASMGELDVVDTANKVVTGCVEELVQIAVIYKQEK